MDIVTRLKEFINYLNIPVTQFADNCSIPRPTLSQLLNGRNKKVSDELIGMFGEGDMLHNSNIEISRPKNDDIPVNSAIQSSEKEENSPSIDFNNLFTQNPSEKISVADSSKESSFRASLDFTADTNRQSDTQHMTIGSDFDGSTASANTITFNPDSNRKIVNIIVYYSDNSFESFVPNSGK